MAGSEKYDQRTFSVELTLAQILLTKVKIFRGILQTHQHCKYWSDAFYKSCDGYQTLCYSETFSSFQTYQIIYNLFGQT